MFRCAHLGTRVAKLGQELEEEQEMNCCLRANQTELQTQLAEEERKGKENGEEKPVPANIKHMSVDSHKTPKLLQWKRKPQHSYYLIRSDSCRSRLMSLKGSSAQNQVIMCPTERLFSSGILKSRVDGTQHLGGAFDWFLFRIQQGSHSSC